MTTAAYGYLGCTIGYATGHAITERGSVGVIWSVVAAVGLVVMLGAWEER